MTIRFFPAIVINFFNKNKKTIVQVQIVTISFDLRFKAIYFQLWSNANNVQEFKLSSF